MRKLASIRKILEIKPIDGADAIELAIVDGWQSAVKKNEFKVGDLVVYCEVDSWIPTDLAPFLSKGKEPREYNGVKGERLRTVKLRGQLSQGLILPTFNDETGTYLMLYSDETGEYSLTVEEGDDVTEALGIQKWEPVIPAQLAGQVKGIFPSLTPKTDQERAQNLVKEIVAANEAGLKFEITEKLEGSSMTCYMIGGEFGVCSRNLNLKRDENNTFWKVAIELDIESKMREVGFDFAVQGELIGPGIQGNIYNLTKHEFHVFDVFVVAIGSYYKPKARRDLIEVMGLKHVPVISESADLYNDLGCQRISDLLKYAEGKSVLNVKQEREGIVFKQVDGGMTFKAISNKYLLNSKD